MTKLKFFSVYVAGTRVNLTTQSEMKYNLEISQFFEQNKVIKWQVVPAFRALHTDVSPILLVEYE